jgi:hypothetical protein
MPYPTTHPPEAADQDVVDLSGAPAARLTAPAELGRRLAALDDRYIRDNFVPLDDVAATWPGGPEHIRAEIAAGRLPQPAYRLDDGTDMVPADYLDPIEEAGSVDKLRDWFEHEYVAAALRFEVDGGPATIEEQWQAYLSGGYFVCLRHASSDRREGPPHHRHRATARRSTSPRQCLAGAPAARRRRAGGDRAAVRDPRSRAMGNTNVGPLVRHVPAHLVSGGVRVSRSGGPLRTFGT